MHIGLKNPKNDYVMVRNVKEIELESIILEKDLGVNVDNKLKFDRHTEIQVKKANKMLGMIKYTEKPKAHRVTPISQASFSFAYNTIYAVIRFFTNHFPMPN